MSDSKYSDDDTEVIQFIKSELETNPNSITHILLVSLDCKDYQNLFSRLANKPFESKVNFHGDEFSATLTWKVLEQNKASNVLYTTSPYSDIVTSSITENILQGTIINFPFFFFFLLLINVFCDIIQTEIADVLNADFDFVVTKPIHYLETERSGISIELTNHIQPVRVIKTIYF